MVKKSVILIVEDEALIRLGAVQMLEDAGFATVEAANADDAIKILELRNDICAVFTESTCLGHWTACEWRIWYEGVGRQSTSS